ncbi:MAG TPA: HEAT repeat domain-containing protein [Polyangia bacterium]
MPSVSTAEQGRVEEIDRLFAGAPATLPRLVVALAEPSWPVRRAVIASLAALGDDAVAPLVENLARNRSDETVIAANVEALVASTGAVEDALMGLVDHPDPAVTADVAQILGRRQHGTAIPALMKLAAHPNDNVAVAAIEGLGRVGSRAAVEALLQTLTSPSFFRVFPAIGVLGRSGDPRVVKPLAGLLEVPPYVVEAAQALGQTGDKAAAAPLARLLASADEPELTAAAAQALAVLDDEHVRRYGTSRAIKEAIAGAVDPAAVTTKLLRVLDSSARVTEAERDRPAGGGDDGTAALCLVLGMLGDSRAVPSLLVVALGQGPAKAAALHALREFGESGSAAITEALGRADGEGRRLLLPLVTGKNVLPAVLASLDDEEADVRAAACDALARLGAVSAVGRLFDRLSDRSAGVVQAAVAAIQSLGSPATEQLAVAKARAPEASVRRWALRILAYFGSPGALDVLLSAMSDPDPRVQEGAIQGLAFVDDPRAQDALLNAARHSSAQVRAVGFRSLGHTAPDSRITAALIRGMNDPDPWVRYYACQSAGRLRVSIAVDGLVTRLADPAPQVRMASVEALSHFEDATAQEALERVALSADDDLQQAAIISLGIARAGQSAVLAALESTSAATRLVAVSALAGFDEDWVTQRLAQAARDPDEGVRTSALSSLASRPEADATPRLIRLFEKRLVPAAQLPDLLSRPGGDRPASLLQALGRADEEVAPLLTAALARLADARAHAALHAALGLPNPAARKAAVATLGAVGGPADLAAIGGLLKSDPDRHVREVCAAVLTAR